MITIISGTNRKASNSLKVSKLYQGALKNKGLESQILDLAELPSDFITNMYGNHTEEVMQLITKNITKASQFVFVIPEYNGTYTGIVKLLIDGVSPSFFKNKKAILVGVASGRAGNIVGLEQFTTVLNHLHVEVLSNKVLLSQIDGLLNPSGEIIDTKTLETIDNQLNKMIDLHLN
ncbi:NAD(P)H-dependent oxidoreductase [Flavobacteriales bacterium]|jgi:NAD(P)H-dependent FMN reductase|nr:NAD(P)H-dependent oxidoreductase [Flavobacteriales bacterium]|tara:strand:- start:7443 stop:7970 length:528 start_codon:yes stop_codon:yes gene_type:complete